VAGDGGRVTLVGVNEQVRPAGVEADTVRLTVAEHPLTVMVEEPELPDRICDGETGLAEIEQTLTTVGCTVMVCVV
jgi:hypothetical protein